MLYRTEPNNAQNRTDNYFQHFSKYCLFLLYSHINTHYSTLFFNITVSGIHIHRNLDLIAMYFAVATVEKSVIYIHTSK